MIVWSKAVSAMAMPPTPPATISRPPMLFYQRYLRRLPPKCCFTNKGTSLNRAGYSGKTMQSRT